MRRRELYNEDQEPLLEDAQTEKKPQWDLFNNIPRETISGSTIESKYINLSVKYLKIFTVTITTLVVLGFAVLSKGTLLFMTSQIKPNITRLYCNKNLDSRQQYIVNLPTEERTVWIWTIIFVYMIPEIGTFIRSIRIVSFKRWKYPTKLGFLIVATTEILPVIGSALLVFIVFPEIDVIKGGMLTNAVCLVPAIIAMLSRSSSESRQMVCYILDISSILVQLSALVMWPIVENKKILFYTIPPALILISVGWWENFLSKKSSIKWITDFAKSRKDIKKDIYFIYAIVTPLKCVIFFLSAVMIIWIREGDVSFLFEKFGDAFSNHPFKVIQIEPVVGTSGINYTDAISNIVPIEMETSHWTPITFLLINIISSYICYAFAKFACKIMIQPMSFALPINLTVPVLLTVLVCMCGNYSENECEYSSVIPSYLFFNTPTLSRLQEFIGHQYSWIWFIWLLSQTWITIHIWSNDHEKLMSTEQIFRKPMYDAFLIDQSIAMNRRRERDRLIKIAENPGPQEISDHQITRIYACATMWHETKEEIVEFLKSVFRMDEDQCAHELVQKYFKIKLQNYYKFEAHIFFDDAFIRKSQDDNDPHVNDYVLNLVDTVSEAASKVHAMNCKIKPPVVYSTPYGGRLEWTLPGNNKMIAHLKDKAKIRAKKRWSQVMYMYYLLGYGIMDNEAFTPPDVNNRAKNTYILALDGDIDFQPSAVHLLVDYMKKNATLGAACGRIHPVGSGAMAWYQVFEYAVGHWLQKATEHVIGCVLCSPGCFSLFRAGALMDDNVMAKYTTESSEALHYVQYDQGEDRWLCTLLLQRGYRVEYSAASDAYTHCPEGFNEFYNQRRRWMPSTTANIMNLLTDYKHIVAANENISILYIIYQLIIMIGTIIGPGTIFLMLIGAFVAAFKISQYTSLIWNVVPVLLFIIICATCKADTQLFFAALITGVYGLVMMTVFVGMMIQIEEDGWMAPSSLFLVATLAEFVIAAIMHPQEFYCLKYMVIYYVTVPSMYMLLVIYSIFNMNNVSWGTREVTVIPKPQEDNKAAAAAATKQAAAPSAKDPLSFLGGSKHNAGSFEFSFGGLFKLLCCTYDSKGEEREVLRNIQASLQQMQQKLDKLEKNKLSTRDSILEPRKTARNTELFVGLKASRASQAMSPLQQSQEYANEDGDADDDGDGDDDIESNFTGSDDIEPNSWYYDGNLVKSRVEFINKRETKFWEKLIGKYLYPLDETKKKDVIAKELKDLRDRMVMTFFMLNALFVLIIYLLNLQQDIIHVNWPINPKVNFTYITDENLVIIQKTYLELQPIGFVFLLMFSSLMLVQFIGMIIHRFGTYCQIMANTQIDVSIFRSGKSEDITETSLLEQDPVKVVKILLKLQGINDEEQKQDDTGIRRDTVHWLALKREEKAKPVIEDLEQAFCKRLSLIHNQTYNDKNLPRETLTQIRRKTVTMRFKNPEFDGSPPDQERISKIILENPAEDEAEG